MTDRADEPTPTPWVVSESGDSYLRRRQDYGYAIEGPAGDDALIIAVGIADVDSLRKSAAANARFIVRACNSHAAMLAALKKITNWLEAQAGRDETRAKDGRFPSLAEACAADAKNYRAMAKDMRAAIALAEEG